MLAFYTQEGIMKSFPFFYPDGARRQHIHRGITWDHVQSGHDSTILSVRLCYRPHSLLFQHMVAVLVRELGNETSQSGLEFIITPLSLASSSSSPIESISW